MNFQLTHNQLLQPAGLRTIRSQEHHKAVPSYSTALLRHKTKTLLCAGCQL